MGRMTRTEIIEAGLNDAGDSSLSTPAVTWLNNWLRKTYEAWEWPFLKNFKTGLALATGDASVTIGAGSGGVTRIITNIFDPVYLYNSGYTVRAVARLRKLYGGPAEIDPDIIDNASNRGQPQFFRARLSTTTAGAWVLYPYPFPDKDYLLKIEYQFLPDALTVGADIPAYPNDATLVKAVEAAALNYMAASDPSFVRRAEAARAETQAAVLEDRINYGSYPGAKDTLGLDGGVFKGDEGDF